MERRFSDTTDAKGNGQAHDETDGQGQETDEDDVKNFEK